MVQLIVASCHELQLRNLKLLVETDNRFIIARSSVKGENLPIALSSSGDKIENRRNDSAKMKVDRCLKAADDRDDSQRRNLLEDIKRISEVKM